MKHFFSLSIIFFFCVSFMNAQKPITLTYDSVMFGRRYLPGFRLTIPEAKITDVKKGWIKKIEKGTKSKVHTVDNEITLFGAMIPDFNKGSANIVSEIAWQDTAVELFVSVETTRDVFVGIKSVEYNALSKYLTDFAKDQYISIAEDQLSAEEKTLKDLEKQNKAERKGTGRQEKRIQSSDVTIKNMNDNIDRYNLEVNTLDIRIGNTSSSLSVLEEGDSKKTVESDLKNFQKQKKKLLKKINSAQNTISRENNKISDSNKEIEQHEDNRKDLDEKIKQQKEVVDMFKQKLKAIKAY